jgi:pimeloyl-ACP methyl ester carboxylesterase
MDPLHEGTQFARFGNFPLTPSISLHYELRGSPESTSKVVLVNGAFGTRRHFEQLAEFLSRSAEVLTYDHQGIGRSTSSGKDRDTSQTSDLLAADAMALLDHVWSTGAGADGLHVYGASMGGMVVQKLALLLLERGNEPRLPLRSLTSVVTAKCCGFARFMSIRSRFHRLVLPMTLTSTPTALVDSLLPKCFSSDFLEEPHPCGTALNMGELWCQRWITEFDDWWSLHDIESTSTQETVAGRHYLNSTELTTLRDSGVPILVVVAEQDELIAPKAQRELTSLLRATTHSSYDGHMAVRQSLRRFAVSCRRTLKPAPGNT